MRELGNEFCLKISVEESAWYTTDRLKDNIENDLREICCEILD
jgi:hypothetical protein